MLAQAKQAKLIRSPFGAFLFVADGPPGHAPDGTLEAGKRRKHVFYRAKLFTGAENTRFVVPERPQCVKVFVLSSGKPGASSEGTPPPLRQHKNVTFGKSAVKLEEKSYVRTRPEKSSGGEGLRPPPKECSKHRTLTKVRSADRCL